ncbi:glycosyltransferase family 2 protein [Pseudotabrizicola algicola]|uniref:Glycosyltransferase family 2 protein n=1 Tax=Pseudotabrizicola algicola TaxID=2709381 RepID=A0A6B3RP51_9RHOB|nr:glycosyltransferase family 2 protein [Pseudotabrizicola algicola]NEX46996.1 glycosyltransferase family 2 protein [Pseudotabrizicola algicola]
MRFAVVCSVRNEGPFLVEWVAWYKRLGFTDIVVVTNDCTDHSPALLDALHPEGVTHLRHDVPDGVDICARKLEAAKALPQVSKADWVLVCDVDEFLVIHNGQGQITDLIPDTADFLGMAINWRVFGTSGLGLWSDGLTHLQFRSCAKSHDFSSTWVKTLHARPDWFRKLGEHGPKRLKRRHALRWGEPGMRWVNADGADIPEWTPGGDYLRRVPLERVSHATAQMNHYMVRAAESFELKRGSLSPVAGKDRYTDGYFDRYNRNEAVDDSALRHRAEFDRVHARLMALPDVARLHHLCCADYVARLAAKAGTNVKDDPRHAHHLGLAGG